MRNALSVVGLACALLMSCGSHFATPSPSSSTLPPRDLTDILHRSRNATVKIVSVPGDSQGTGFLINDQYVATAFHVIGSHAQHGSQIDFQIFADIRVTFPTGEEISATCTSIPTQTDMTPIADDFAILKLASRPQSHPASLPLAQDSHAGEIGDDIVFSGYPLDVPVMVTHRGFVSGRIIEPTILALQAPINKGNSGGAVLNANGEVIGIITLREGGISKGLETLREQIRENAKSGSITFNNIDPLLGVNAVIDTLDKYISPGIGYALGVRYLREYIRSHPRSAG